MQSRNEKNRIEELTKAIQDILSLQNPDSK
jgi:hypothetical protein